MSKENTPDEINANAPETEQITEEPVAEAPVVEAPTEEAPAEEEKEEEKKVEEKKLEEPIPPQSERTNTLNNDSAVRFVSNITAAFTPPRYDTTVASERARTTFQEGADELCRSLELLHEGGFQGNARHLYMLDEKGNFVQASSHDLEKDNSSMVAAAQDGRLYIMDRYCRLRQVQLEGNEKDGFTFSASKPLSNRQRPIGRWDYYSKCISTLVDDFKTDLKRDRERLDRFFDRIDNFFKRVDKFFESRGKDKKQAEAKVEEGSLIPEEETLQTEQTASTPEVKPEETKEKTVEELLATNPTKQTTPEFEQYLNALSARRNENPVKAALEKENGTPEDYYEALSQELEGKIAGDILHVAPDKELNPAGREKFLHDQKPVMASMSKGLRKFVEEKVDSALVEDYYKAHAGKKDGLDMQKSLKQMKLESEAAILVGSGAGDYMKSVIAQNAANQQTMPQPQQVQKQQTVPTLKQTPPSKQHGM